ncbi:MAG: hypothetical protein L0G89_11450 [Janibacter sp.]|nr:hypothetical protein [Janibacter sp.]
MAWHSGSLTQDHPWGRTTRLVEHVESLEAYPQEGDLDAMCRAIDAAWEMQQAP